MTFNMNVSDLDYYTKRKGFNMHVQNKFVLNLLQVIVYEKLVVTHGQKT